MRRLLALAASSLAALLLFEVGSCVSVERGWLASPRPTRVLPKYWRGDHPSFGVWRHPDVEYEHTTACFRARYRTNSLGARDRERRRQAPLPRVVVLGDSQMEGWGLAEDERLSNRLEAATGIEHLNFAMAHFGPYQSLIAYRELASGFDHDAVILGLFPMNDFIDIDLDLARRMPGYEYRYRPYLLGAAPDFAHVDHREPLPRRLLRRHSYAFNALLHALLLRSQVPVEDFKALRGGGRKLASWFYDFEEAQIRRLERILELWAEAARDKRLALLLIPSQRDLERFAREGPAPLARRLGRFAEGHGIRIVNLLPGMAQRGVPFERLFLSCDYHWSALGNAVALELAREELGADFYMR